MKLNILLKKLLKEKGMTQLEFHTYPAFLNLKYICYVIITTKT